MGGDALGGDLRRHSADAGLKVVVASGGEWPSVAVAQQRVARHGGAAQGGVLDEVPGEFDGDRLLALCFTLLPEPQRAVLGVDVLQPQGESSAASAGCLGVQS